MANTITGNKFYGIEISRYGIENGYVDYATLAKSFDAVLCNDIASRLGETLDIVQGETENEYGDYVDIFQYYIISDEGYRILSYWCPDEIVFYDNELGVYVWGITHFGTSWSYVLTDIKIENGKEDE